MQEEANLRRLPTSRRTALARLMAAALLATSTVFLMMACGSEAPPGDPGPGGEVAPHVTPEAADQPPDALNELEIRAREVLAVRLSVPAGSLTLVKHETVQWSDASLGCPQERMMYAQAITPGHRMTFRHNEDTYEVHTADAGSAMEPVSCEGGVSY